MAGFPVQNFVAVGYRGAIYSVPVNLGTYARTVNNTGTIVKQGHQSQIVPSTFDWLNVYTTQAVLMNLQTQGGSPPLDQLLMMYVDNSGNASNVTIIFPDTQMAVNVPAQSTGYYPVFTAGLICSIYNGSTGTVPSATLSTTTIQFCNFAIPGYLTIEGIGIAAPTLYRVSNVGNVPQYVTPALGDTNAFAALPLVSVNPAIQVLSVAPVGSKYIITNFQIHLYEVYNDPTNPFVQGNIYLTDNAAFFREYPFVSTIELQESYRYKILAQEIGIYGVAKQLILGFANSAALSQGFAGINVSYATIPV